MDGKRARPTRHRTPLNSFYTGTRDNAAPKSYRLRNEMRKHFDSAWHSADALLSTQGPTHRDSRPTD
jgi:hypothetical protein